jgi:hypothetical protein
MIDTINIHLSSTISYHEMPYFTRNDHFLKLFLFYVLCLAQYHDIIVLCNTQ